MSPGPHWCAAATLLLLLLLVCRARGDSLTLLEVQSVVSSRHEVTTLTATLHNRHAEPRPLACRLDLPHSAFVTRLVIEAGGHNLTSAVRRRGRRRRPPTGGPTPAPAAANYFSIKKREGGLQRFRAVASVPGESQAKFHLSYEQVLRRTRGAYSPTFHFASSQRVDQVVINLMVKEMEILEFVRLESVPSNSSADEAVAAAAAVVVHGVGSNFALASYASSADPHFTAGARELRPFALSYDVQRRPDGGELQVSGPNFVLYFAPEGLPGLSKHTVFVLDISGSMDDNNKLDSLKDAMAAILADFQQHDSFQIVVFSTHVRSLGTFQAQGRELRHGIHKVRALDAYGGTNINGALLRGLADAHSHGGSQRYRQLVFLTDGKPTVDERDTDAIRRNVREANKQHYPIFALAFGPDAELKFLRQMCADNRGVARRITDRSTAARQIHDFFDEVSRPLLADVAVSFPEGQVNVSSLVTLGQDTFYDGDEIVYAGQLAAAGGPLEPSVAGVGQDGPTTLRVSRRHSSAPASPSPDLQRVWAYLAVQDLLESQDLVDDPNLRSEMRARALHIALMNGFVTKLTGLSMTPSSDDEAPNDEPSPQPQHPVFLSDHPHGPGESGRILPHSAGDVVLLSKEDLAASLPSGLQASLGATQNRRFSFVDNDPHFVVQVPGLALPLCFDVHGRHGDVLSVINDPKSGIRVSGEVTAAAGSSSTTYFTRLYVALRRLSVTVTPSSVTVHCLRPAQGAPEVLPTTSPRPRRRRHPHKTRQGRRRHSPPAEVLPVGTSYHRRRHRRHRRARRSVMDLSARFPHPQRVSEARSPSGLYGPHPHLHTAAPLDSGLHRRLQSAAAHSSEGRPRVQPLRYAALDVQVSSASHVSRDGEGLSPHNFHPHSSFDDHLHHSDEGDLPASPELFSHPASDRLHASPGVHPHSSLDLHPHFSSPNNHIGISGAQHFTKPTHTHMAYFSPSLASQRWNYTSLMKEIDRAGLSNEEREKFEVEIKDRLQVQTSGPESPRRHVSGGLPMWAAVDVREDKLTDPFTSTGSDYSSEEIHSSTTRTGSGSEEMLSTATRNSRYDVAANSKELILNYTLGENDLDGGSIYSDGEIHYRRTDVPLLARRGSAASGGGSGDPGHVVDDLVDRCQQELAWEDISGRRFEDVMFRVRNNRKLNIMMGDLEAHFTITRTKNKHGQHFLGFYVEEQNVLSPLTTGIIGQFAFKTVTLKRPTTTRRASRAATASPAPTNDENSVELLVLHVGEDGGGGARISEVRAIVEKRRSLLHKVQVPCLYVGAQGKGLLTHPASAYTIPCLQC